MTTAEVWDWHENVDALNDMLIEKSAVYNRFIGYLKTAYGNQANWSEPPTSYEFGDTTLSAQEWGVIVLYNGALGVPWSSAPGNPGVFRSPWIFDPVSGTWTFHDNRRVYKGQVRRYATEIEPEFRNPPPVTEE